MTFSETKPHIVSKSFSCCHLINRLNYYIKSEMTLDYYGAVVIQERLNLREKYKVCHKSSRILLCCVSFN